jgi:hypothetical protein
LFSLGIALLELWYASPINVLREEVARDVGEPDISTFEAAEQWIEWLYTDAGKIYADVVQRCILGLDHRDTDFESDGFKQEVYQRIVLPLEGYIRVFRGELQF